MVGNARGAVAMSYVAGWSACLLLATRLVRMVKEWCVVEDPAHCGLRNVPGATTDPVCR